MAKQIVLGGGLSALVFAFYNPNFVVITKEIKSVDTPFVFIHATKYAKQMLSDLSISFETETVKIYPKKSKSVIKNKVGKEDKSIGIHRISEVKEGFNLEVIKLKESEIIMEIYRKIKDRIIIGGILKITKENIFYITPEKKEKSFKYSALINTLSFDIFEKVHNSWYSGEKIEHKQFFFKIENKEIEKSTISYKDNDDGLIKIVKNSITNQIGYEYKEKNINAKICSSVSRFVGKISAPPKNTIFLGRFATANPDWRIEDSIFVAQKGYMLSKMLAEQKRFDEAVEEINPISKDERCKDLILHLFSETSELLREINWKTHTNEKKSIKLTSILEECVDIMKLVFGIMLIQNYTEREIYEKFFSKSKLVWDRFLDSFYGGV